MYRSHTDDYRSTLNRILGKLYDLYVICTSVLIVTYDSAYLKSPIILMRLCLFLQFALAQFFHKSAFAEIPFPIADNVAPAKADSIVAEIFLVPETKSLDNVANAERC